MSTDLKILQINLNCSALATESALQYSIENKIDIIIVQEPWLVRPSYGLDYKNTHSVVHQGFIQLIPNTELRPRTLAYIARNSNFNTSISSISPKDPDLLILDITSGNFDFQLVNIYNKADQEKIGPKTLERVLYPISNSLQSNLLVLGDFNLHHAWWDPLTNTTTPGSKEFIDWTELKSLELLNEPGIGTFYRPNLIRESVLDLSLATPILANKVQNWSITPSLGSDHFGITFNIKNYL